MKGLWFAFAVIVGLVALSGLIAAPVGAQTDADVIKTVIESLAKALTTRDLDTATAVFADDAKIDSLVAKAKVSKTQWVERMAAFWRQNPSPPATEYRGLTIKLSDVDHATVDGEYYLKSANPENRGFSGNAGYLQWRLEKRAGKWLVVETTYK
jgi:hypothetical protein